MVGKLSVNNLMEIDISQDLETPFSLRLFSIASSLCFLWSCKQTLFIVSTRPDVNYAK